MVRTNDFDNIFEKIRSLTRSRLQYLSFLGTLFLNSILEGGYTKLTDGQTSSTSRLTDCIVERTILIIFSKKLEL